MMLLISSSSSSKCGESHHKRVWSMCPTWCHVHGVETTQISDARLSHFLSSPAWWLTPVDGNTPNYKTRVSRVSPCISLITRWCQIVSKVGANKSYGSPGVLG